MNAPIHVAITRRVKPGHEREFERAPHVFARNSLGEPGMRGVYLLNPAPDSGSNEYGIIRSFATAAGIVVVLTWVAMPVLVRLARGWLLPKNLSPLEMP